MSDEKDAIQALLKRVQARENPTQASNPANDQSTESTTSESKLLRADKAARYLNVSAATLRDLPIPQVRLKPRLVQWNIDDLDRYIADKTQYPDGGRYPIRLPHPRHKDYGRRRVEMLKKAEELAQQMHPGKRITGDRLWDAIEKLTGERRPHLPTWEELRAKRNRDQ